MRAQFRRKQSGIPVLLLPSAAIRSIAQAGQSYVSFDAWRLRRTGGLRST